MSSLHDSISRRRAEESTGPSCVTVGGPQPALLVAIWEGQNWVFPWSYLVNAKLTDPPGELEMSFSSHVVMVEGDNLRRVLDDLALFRVAGLRDLPAEYRAQLPADAPFIRRIIVRPVPAPLARRENPGREASDTDAKPDRS